MIPDNAKAKISDIEKKKAEGAVELQRDLEERRVKLVEEKKEDQQQKEDLIRQIKALERVPKTRVLYLNPNEVRGEGKLTDIQEKSEILEKMSKLFQIFS